MELNGVGANGVGGNLRFPESIYINSPTPLAPTPSSSEASSQKFSEYIQNGCLKEAKLSKLPIWGRFAAPKGWFD